MKECGFKDTSSKAKLPGSGDQEKPGPQPGGVQSVAEIKLLKLAPRSAKTSILIPFASFSVIMLLPTPAFSTLLIGTATRLTNNKETNHIIKIPFQALHERNIPVFKEVNIFIYD